MEKTIKKIFANDQRKRFGKEICFQKTGSFEDLQNLYRWTISKN